MLILTIRTDKPEAEVGLYEDRDQLGYEVWQGHKRLSGTIHTKIFELLQQNGKTWHDLQGIVCFKGPGSFTGLRVGASVANALAYGLQIPLVAEQNAWIEQGIDRLIKGEHDQLVQPEYGGEAHITAPKK